MIGIPDYEECSICVDPIFVTWILRKCFHMHKFIAIYIINKIGCCYKINTRLNSIVYYECCAPKWAAPDVPTASFEERYKIAKSAVESYLRVRRRSIDSLDIYYNMTNKHGDRYEGWKMINFKIIITIAAMELKRLIKPSCPDSFWKVFDIISLVPPCKPNTMRRMDDLYDMFETHSEIGIRWFGLGTRMGGECVQFIDVSEPKHLEVIYYICEPYLEKIKDCISIVALRVLKYYEEKWQNAREDQTHHWYYKMAEICDT